MSRRIRLNRVLRQRLFNIIAKMPCPEEEQALQAARHRAAVFGDILYWNTVPARDADVLTRWGLGMVQDFIPVTPRGGNRWSLDHWPLSSPQVVPVSAGHGTNDALIQTVTDKSAWELFDAWVAARKAHKDALDALHADYRKLVNGCVFLDEVEAVWPGAGAIREPEREKPVTSLTTLVPPDVMERIRRRETKTET